MSPVSAPHSVYLSVPDLQLAWVIEQEMGQCSIATDGSLICWLIYMDTKGMDAFWKQACQRLMNHTVALQAGVAGKIFPCNANMIMATAMLFNTRMACMFPGFIFNSQGFRVKRFR